MCSKILTCLLRGFQVYHFLYIILNIPHFSNISPAERKMLCYIISQKHFHRDCIAEIEIALWIVKKLLRLSGIHVSTFHKCDHPTYHKMFHLHHLHSPSENHKPKLSKYKNHRRIEKYQDHSYQLKYKTCANVIRRHGTTASSALLT